VHRTLDDELARVLLDLRCTDELFFLRDGRNLRIRRR
jgi:hypothetical protein